MGCGGQGGTVAAQQDAGPVTGWDMTTGWEVVASPAGDGTIISIFNE